MRVELAALHKSWPTPGEPLVVLDGVDWMLGSGDVVAVVGPSGCGKSTLLHIVGTLEEPDSGRVQVGGIEPFALPPNELAAFRNRHIGFVFQDHYLLPQLTVLENVLVPTLVASESDSGAEEHARALLERVGIAERLGHRPAELSGGERQRVAVARALVRRPGLVLCDEPTGNLDARTAETVADFLFELRAELGTTLVIVTHSASLAARVDRRFEFVDHRLVAVGA